MKIHFEWEKEGEKVVCDGKGFLLFPFISFTNNPRPKLLKYIKKYQNGTVIEKIYQQENNGKKDLKVPFGGTTKVWYYHAVKPPLSLVS